MSRFIFSYFLKSKYIINLSALLNINFTKTEGKKCLI